MRAPAARGSSVLPPVRARTETDTYRKRTSHSQWWEEISKGRVSEERRADRQLDQLVLIVSKNSSFLTTND